MVPGQPPTAQRVDDSAGSARRLPWKQKLLAVFVTLHLGAVLLFILPYPPYYDPSQLNNPYVQREMHLFFGTLKPLAPWWETEQEMQTKVLGYLQSYINGYFKVRKVVEPYIYATGSSQSWNMFAGSPGRNPMVFMVEVRPIGESEWVVFQDLNWGTKDYANTHFRHHKAMANLTFPNTEQDRAAYGRYWARRWNRLHPSRRALWVRTYYLRLTTRAPADVRAGIPEPAPEKLDERVWRIPDTP
jgi:hypothetical protein